MRFFVSIIVEATCFTLLITSMTPALPPQVTALNDFIRSDQQLADRNCCFRAVIDGAGNATLIYYRSAWNYYEQKNLNYLSFDPEGRLQIEEHTVLQDFTGLSLNQYESQITTDSNRNIHLVMRDRERSLLDEPLLTYVMIDTLGSLKKRIQIDNPLSLSSIRILESDDLLVHGGYGQLNQPDSEFVMMLRKDADKFESFSVETPNLGYRTTNIGAQIYPLGDEHILLLSSFSSPYVGKTIIRKTIISLAKKSIVSVEALDARQVASIFYYNKPQDINYFHSRILSVGDTIVYLCGLPSLADPPVPMDSMCVVLFESDGKLITRESADSYPIEIGFLATIGKNDFLIMNNRDHFGEYRSTSKNRLSLYGLMSLGHFPRIIVDLGTE